MGRSKIFRIELQICFRLTQVDAVECVLLSNDCVWTIRPSPEDSASLPKYLVSTKE